TWPADAADDRVGERDRAAAVAGLDVRPQQQLWRFELLDEVMRPEHFAGSLLERKQLLRRSDRKHAIADNERRRVRTRPETEILEARARRIGVLPDRRAGPCVERDDCFFLLPGPGLCPAVPRAVHREQPAAVGGVHDDGGVAGAER